MKILIADKFEASGIDELRGTGCDVLYEPTLQDDGLRETIGRAGCDVLVVRSTRVTESMLDASGALSLVVRAGAGFNTIDVQAASRRSILVANCPGKNAVAVAELTFGLILALDRRIVDNATDLRNGVWNKKQYAQAAGLKGKTLGIVGLGQIGRVVALRGYAFEMHSVAWSRSLTEELAAECKVLRCDSLAELASRCDILTVHLPATPETSKIINAEVFDGLKPGAYVINTARAEVMDYQALAIAVKERGLRVGLDVYPDEPAGGAGPFTDPILDAGGIIYGTHHIGASTQQAQHAIAAEAVRIVRTFLETGRVLNCVNLRTPTGGDWCLRVRHLNQPGVLAHVLRELSHAGINVSEMDNIITAGAKAAAAHIRLDAEPSAETINRITEGNESVLAVSLAHGTK